MLEEQRRADVVGKPHDNLYLGRDRRLRVGLVWAVWQSKRESKHGMD